MTTPQPAAMPELPEPFALSLSIHDGENCKWPLLECKLLQKHPAEKQHLYTADQMRAYALAALQSQPAAAVSDAEISRLWSWSATAEAERTATTQQHAFAYALLALRPQSDHLDTARCIKARNDLNAALHGEGALIDDLEHAVANACAILKRRRSLAGDRADFEEWMSEGGKWPKAVERGQNGDYLLLQTATNWATWQACASLRPQAVPMTDEPEWIVNDLGELGVRVGSRFFFLYKGGNIEYGADGIGDSRDGVALHADGTPMHYRIVGKREFGETCWPLQWVVRGHSESRYTEPLTFIPGLSWGTPEDGEWKPLPAHGITAQGAQGGEG